MPYKIYTYSDPYRIADTDFWKNIKMYPHFCAARTLVNGLVSVMRNDIEGLMCPLDDIVNERIFNKWAKDISLRIQQYSAISEAYRDWYKNHNLDENYYSALSHNKDSMLDAIRLFIELDIDPKVLDVSNLNMEHRMFAYLLKLAKGHELFSLPKMPSLKEIRKIFNEQAEFEKAEKEKLHGENPESELLKSDIELIEKMIQATKEWDGKHVVIHGVHQFTPLQLKFIKHLDELGIEVIFLYNYLPEYKEMYSSWSYIYQQFDAPIYHDQKVKSYVPAGQLQKPGNAIASNIALLCEENTSRTDKRIRDNYALYQNEKVYEFDNISEYAGYISDKFLKAELDLEEQSPLSEKPMKKKPGTASVLARMDELVYTANREVDDLLQVYHPEYSRSRHFLAYPIGQFFSAIYSLWNTESGEIDIEYNLLRECLNSGILSNCSAEKLLKTLMNLEPIFANITCFSDFQELFGKKYLESYKQVTSSTKGAISFPLRSLNIYNAYKVTKEDVDELNRAIIEINNIAKSLFSDIGSDAQFVFQKHFERLEEFVRERKSSLASEEEKELITDLLTRLDVIQLMNTESKGTFEDLRSGLYFFLKQKEESRSDWFVKNFEQIDGDVLNSKQQNAVGRKKTYHFACVSDLDMNKSVDDLLPWPLSELFIEKAYNPKDLQFQVYYAALSERSNFLRYALFYGLYFNQCDTKISFVKRYGDNTTDYYEMLKLIGLEKTDGPADLELDDSVMSTVVKAKPVKAIQYDREQAAAMFLCPYKYLFDYILNPSPIVSGGFLIQKSFENILIENTWKEIQNTPQKQAEKRLGTIVAQEAQRLKQYFSFLRETEVLDIQRRAENYITAKVFDEAHSSGNVRPLEPTHMQLRKTFGDAWFKENIQDLPKRHPYKSFEQLSRVEDGMKVYSTHSAPKAESKPLMESMLDYINNTDENLERVGGWCAFCANKSICLAPYAESKE